MPILAPQPETEVVAAKMLCHDGMVGTAALLRLFLDPDRLAVIGALAADSQDTASLIEATGCDRQTVLVAVGDFRNVGLVTLSSGEYQLDRAALRAAAVAAAGIELPMDPVIGFGMTAHEQQVLGRFFSGRVLNEIPTHRAKRQIVLQRLALEFDVGRRYSEAQVNALLVPFHRDVATLRREMVEEGLLDRERAERGQEYWRSGGRVASLPT